jgi:putative membrane protein
MLNIILALLLGIITGTITGLIPGVHINLITVLLLSFPALTLFPVNVLIVFITAMAITHTFIDFIPSTFLGAPDEDTVLGVLPGHSFLIKGMGHHAVKLTIIGSTIATMSLILIVPLFIIIIPKIFPFIQRMMAFFLIWATIFLIYKERESKRKAIIILILSGLLGLITLNSNINQPLLPLLTGLFGTSTIIYSIKSKTIVPEQKINKTKIHKKDLIKPTIATIIVSPICSFFPGLGSSQAAIIGSEITGELNQEQFLILLGSINTLVMATSFVTLFLIQKSRTGAAFAISQLTQITTNDLWLILLTIFITSAIAIPITITISKTLARRINKIPYTKLSIAILILLLIIIMTFSGILGLITLGVSTLIGLTCIEFETRRSLLMGAILIPTIIYYLPF